MTAYGTIPLATRAMRAGAVHVLEKPHDDQQLIDVVQEAILIDSRRRAEFSRRAEGRARLALLSHRERELLDLIVGGHSNKAIARRLSLSTKTVEFHRSNMMSKLQVRNVADLFRLVLPLLDGGPKSRTGVHADTPLP